jgi:SAM-dependent methyltransferase
VVEKLSNSFKLVKYYNWLIFKIINPALEPLLKKYAHGRTADIGCGEKPYKEILSHLVDEHIGIDHPNTIHNRSNIDIFSDAYKIDIPDESIDFILCTDVLEHLEEPKQAIAEAYRILKKGKYVIYTVPLFWHLHEEPRDFYRYTKYGMSYLFEQNGFKIIEIISLSGFIVTFTQLFAYYLLRFRKGKYFNPLWWFIPPFVFIVQRIAYLLNKIDNSKMFTVEYIVVAHKP